MKTNKASKLITGLTVLGFLVLLMSSCSNEKEQLIEDQSSTIEQLENEIASKENDFEDILNLLDKAEAEMVKITKRETLVANASGEQRKEQLLEQIKVIDQLLENSGTRIEELSNKVKKSDLKSVALQKRVNNLAAALKSRDESIASLKEEILNQEEKLTLIAGRYDSLQLKTTMQKVALNDQEKQISMLTSSNEELNKVHYIVGSPKDLKAKGLVDKEGGLFGFLGRNTTIAPSADEQEFIEIDMGELTELPLAASKVELVSEHPADSYEIVQDEIEEDIKYLKIKDPKTFWKVSKYLVISVKS